MFGKITFLLCLIFCLYKLKYEVITLEEQESKIDRELISLKHDYVVLSAEWKFLTNPERIQYLTEKYLKLSNTDPFQLAKMNDYLRNNRQNIFVVSKKIEK